MLVFLFLYSALDIALSTIVLARTFFEDIKAGMLIYLFANISNLIVSYFRTDKLVYYNPTILVITTGFTLSTIFYFLSIYMKMPSITFNNYYSLKILIVSVFSIYLLQAKYNKFQWIGKVLITSGILTQFYNDKNNNFSWVIVTALCSGLFNALSTVMFEYKIKDSLGSIWEYLFTFNLCYIPFNLLAAVLENEYYDNSRALFMLPFYILVFLNVLSLQLSVYLSMRVDSFERTIISVICNILSSSFSDIIMKFELDYVSLISFLLVFLGTILYICYRKHTRSQKEQI